MNTKLIGRDKKLSSGWLGLGGGAGTRVTANGYGMLWESDEDVLELVLVMIAQLCPY